MRKTATIFALVLSVMLLVTATAWGSTPVPMSSQSGLTYTENFADIANWTNAFAAGIGASRFASVAVNATGTIPDGVKTTSSTATFSTSSSTGVQKGTGNILFLCSGTTDNTTSIAIDFFVDFTGVNAGTISFDWAEVTNSTGNRCSSLRVYTSTDGTTFTELTGAAVLNVANGVVASGSITTVSLPSSFNNCSTARIRFYECNGTGGTTGSRAKISVDNLNVTATMRPEPTAQPTTLVFANVGSTAMDVSFTAASPAPESYIAIRRTGAAPTGTPSDGTSYTVGQTIGDGTVAFVGSGHSFSESGLTASTEYDYAVYSYNGSGLGANYLLTSPLTGNQTTIAPSASTTSDIVAVSSSEAATISSLTNDSSPLSSSTGTQAWQITIRDGGASSPDADSHPTIVTALTFTQGGSNTVSDWTTAVLAADLFDGSTHLASATINATSLVFTGLTATAADDGTKTLSLRISLKASGLTDNQIFQFSLTAANTSTQSDVNSSQMTSFSTISSDGAKDKIDVIATKLTIITSPHDFVNLSTNFSFSLEARDANNNKDLDASSNVTATRASGTGTLSASSGVTKALSAGSVSWTDLQFDHVEVGVSLTTTNAGSLTNPTSSTFEVSRALLVENFSYTASSALTANGWTAHSAGGTNAITITGSGLTYTGDFSSGVGNAASMTTTGEDDNRTFTQVSSGSVYVSFMVNVSAAQTTGDYFFHLSVNPTGVQTSRVFAKDVSGALFFGVAKASVAAYTSGSYSYGSTHLIVLKYTFNGSTTDDVVGIYVDPTITAPEPGSFDASGTTSEADAVGIGSINLRQGTNTSAPTLTIDGIRVTDSWSDDLFPVELNSFTALARSSKVELNWSTATEVSNTGFEIQRKAVVNQQSTITNQQAVASGWTKIGFVEGAGTSNVPKKYNFTDAVTSAGKYSYRLKQIDRDGSFKYSDQVEASAAFAAEDYKLTQNYPNPFNPATMIRFAVKSPQTVTLKVYNAIGQEVRTLFNQDAVADTYYNVSFDGTGLASGVYYYRLRTADRVEMKKMLMLK